MRRALALTAAARTKEAAITLDTDVGGRADAFNPAELSLAAIAACLIKGIARVIPMLNFELRGVEVAPPAVAANATTTRWPRASSICSSASVSAARSTARDEARRAAVDYIEMFHNPTRKHAHNGMLSPIAFDRRNKAKADGVRKTRGGAPKRSNKSTEGLRGHTMATHNPTQRAP